MMRARRLLALLLLALIVSGPFALSATAAPAARPHEALADSLVAYWKLDEASGTRVDELSGCGGGGCDLTDNNTVGSAAGIIGNAGDFELGNSEHLSAADHADLSTGDIDFSISLWVQIESETQYHPLISKSDSDQNNLFEYTVYCNTTCDTFSLRVGNTSTSGVVQATTFGAPSIATWYFVVAWHDATADTLNIQVNNGAVDSVSYSGGSYDGANPFRIGAWRTSTYFHDGLIDEVGFWKRVLTSDERTLLYNSGAGCTYPFTACEATPTPTSTDAPTSTPTATYTPTPPPSATPPFEFSGTLDSGEQFLVERRWTYGERGIFLAVVALIAVNLVQFTYTVVRFEFSQRRQK